MDTINGMRVFVSVVEAGSFTSGAKREEMSVALVSKYIAQLEARLGVRLLNRTTRSLTLTEIGKIYLDQARLVLDSFDQLESSIRDKNQALSGRLAVAAPVGFGEKFMTPIIIRFMEKFPLIAVDLQLADRFINLADESVDVAIRISELPDAGFIAKPIATAKLVCCASANYLKQHGTPAHPRELAKHRCIIDKNLRDPGNWPFMVNDAMQSFKVTGRFSVNSARASKTMVLADKGIAVMPAFEVEQNLKDGSVVAILEKFSTYELGINAIYLDRRHLAAKTRSFIDFTKSCFSENPGFNQK